MANIHETRYKKNLKTRLSKQQAKTKKKQEKLAQRKTALKQDKSKSSENTITPLKNKNNETDSSKIVFNKETKMVFNKIDFSGLENEEVLNRKQKFYHKDPNVLLERLKKTKLKVNELEKSGEKLKAQSLKDKQMWMSALGRSEGVKVKDDEVLLKKTIQKRKEMKKKSKKKWDARIKATEKMKEDKQKKRQENIAAKIKQKKSKKMKQAVKRGRIIL